MNPKTRVRAPPGSGCLEWDRYVSCAPTRWLCRASRHTSQVLLASCAWRLTCGAPRVASDDVAAPSRPWPRIPSHSSVAIKGRCARLTPTNDQESCHSPQTPRRYKQTQCARMVAWRFGCSIPSCELRPRHERLSANGANAALELSCAGLEVCNACCTALSHRHEDPRPARTPAPVSTGGPQSSRSATPGATRTPRSLCVRPAVGAAPPGASQRPERFDAGGAELEPREGACRRRRGARPDRVQQADVC